MYKHDSNLECLQCHCSRSMCRYDQTGNTIRCHKRCKVPGFHHKRSNKPRRSAIGRVCRIRRRTCCSLRRQRRCCLHCTHSLPRHCPVLSLMKKDKEYKPHCLLCPCRCRPDRSCMVPRWARYCLHCIYSLPSRRCPDLSLWNLGTSCTSPTVCHDPPTLHLNPGCTRFGRCQKQYQ